jgi:DNA repair protein RadC
LDNFFGLIFYIGLAFWDYEGVIENDSIKRFRRNFMKEVAVHDRPREKLFSFGAEVLGDDELLAILIGSGNVKSDVMSISRSVLGKYGFGKLSRLSVSQLEKEFGIGRAKACSIVACFEMGRRAISSRGEKVVIREAVDVVKSFGAGMIDLGSEHFRVVFLNSRRRVLCARTLFVGTLDESVVAPREVFKVALEVGAAGVVLMHNHPSGEASASEEDILITRRLVEAGRVMGVDVLDHVIVGRDGWTSLAEDGFF